MQVHEIFPLVHHNTFGIHAVADRFVEYDSTEELQDYLTRNEGKRKLHIGQGSNLLFTQDFHGDILHSRIRDIRQTDSDGTTCTVSAGAGVAWDDFVAFCVDNGLYGLENLSLIPGEVGASAVQNIGAYGAEVKDFIQNVETVNLLTGEREVIDAAACNYGYRYSNFKGSWKNLYAVTHVTYRLNRSFIPNLNYAAVRSLAERDGALTACTLREQIIAMRRAKLPDPAVLGNAGSFFMNPIISVDAFHALQKTYPDIPYYNIPSGIKVPAGWLIEQCGWKGRGLGRAGIYEKQALVVVNLGGATGADIVALSNRVCQDVYDKFGIRIKPEVNWI